MRIVELRCPNCGALIQHEATKCKYCGANFVLAVDGSLTYEEVASCLKCGFSIPKGSWICTNCGEVLTKDIKALKELQKKVRFEQYAKRKSLPSTVREKLKPDEFVYSSISQAGFWSTTPVRIYAVTSERLIKLEKEHIEILWSNVVNVDEIEYKKEVLSFPRHEFVVHTFEGDVKFRHYIYAYHDTLALADFTRLHSDAIRVLENHNLRKRDLKVQVCFLPLGQEFAFEKEEKMRYPEELFTKYRERYAHNPTGVLEWHIDRKMREGKTRAQAIKELLEETTKQ